MTNTRVGDIPGVNSPLGLQRVYPYYISLNTTASALGKTACLAGSIVSDIRFKTTSSGGETIKVSGSKDDSAYTDLIPIDETTGLAAASVNLATGTYTLKLKNNAQWKFFKFTKSATSSAGVVVLTCGLTRPPTGAFL